MPGIASSAPRTPTTTPPRPRRSPAWSTQGAIDVEKIVGLEADLVLAGGNGFNSPEALTKLRSVGIPVLVVYAPDVATVLADIELVATAAGEGAAGTELAGAMRTDIDAIASGIAAAGGPRPRVFYELDLYQGTIYGPAAESLYAEMITLAGGEPITTGSPTVFSIPLETLVDGRSRGDRPRRRRLRRRRPSRSRPVPAGAA